MKKILSMLMTAIITISTIVGSVDATSDLKSIYETAKDAGQFSTLLAALDKAKLSDVFKNPGSYTVFAPTDEAFNLLLKENHLTATQLLESPDLSSILKYHVLSGNFLAKDVLQLQDGTDMKTLNGSTIMINKNMNKLFINDSEVVNTDIKASNGTIHVINKVLMPSDEEINRRLTEDREESVTVVPSGNIGDGFTTTQENSLNNDNSDHSSNVTDPSSMTYENSENQENQETHANDIGLLKWILNAINELIALTKSLLSV